RLPCQLWHVCWTLDYCSLWVACSGCGKRPDSQLVYALSWRSRMAYKAVRVTKGRGGWGGPLTIKPQPGKDLIYCVTGGGIHPVAQRIADLTGGKAFDGFRSSAPEKQIACVVIDCGGTARIGVYPMKRLPTIDAKASSPSGPLIQFIKEDIFVSGVKPEDIKLVE